jgi:hypothetical protein
VAVGLADSLGISIPTLDNLIGLLSQYQSYVPNSYQIVHAADLVPILPPTALRLGPLSLTCAQVNEPYQLTGSGATAQASVDASGAVTGVTVNNEHSTGYSTFFPPRVVFSGGSGSGASVRASVSLLEKRVEVTITNPGAGYFTAPTVQILSSGSLTKLVHHEETKSTKERASPRLDRPSLSLPLLPLLRALRFFVVLNRLLPHSSHCYSRSNSRIRRSGKAPSYCNCPSSPGARRRFRRRSRALATAGICTCEM